MKKFYQNKNVFEYGDKHFLGVGIFPPKNERDFSKTLWNDREMNFKNRNGEEIPYTYHNFMNASKDTVSDVFRCYENGKLYVPGEKELFGYTGKYRSIDNSNQQKSGNKKKHPREAER